MNKTLITLCLLLCMTKISLQQCAPNEFDNDPPNLDCQPCDGSCATCDGGTAGDCLTCTATDEWVNAGTCEPCDSSCATCDGGNADDCLTCDLPLVLYTDECKNPPTCAANEFINDATGDCDPCDASCATCDGGANTDCLTCTAADEWVNAGTCESCDSSCATCDGGNADDCLTCELPLVLYTDECKTPPTCQADEFINDVTGDCDPCDASCATCNGGADDNCLTCAATDEWVNNGECEPCDTTCASCNGGNADNCLTCDLPLVLYTNECKTPPTCTATQFINTATGNCDACHDTCATCTGAANTQCTTCEEPRVFENGRCNGGLILTSLSAALGLLAYLFF